ncbi:hypothetical protein M3Y99_01610600 [Aphelenchoides fujianensis]|nr:hypothetical protein M3Y99_01610600 [Aphelenchoides fujianensis]
MRNYCLLTNTRAFSELRNYGTTKMSTAAGIPDFRGPNGIWTKEKRSKKARKIEEKDEPKEDLRFEHARPTLSHHILIALEKHNYVKYLLTQNVDGLHSRFGFPMDRLAEVHGNVFVERCDRCQKQAFRETPLLSVGRRPTGRNCERSVAGRACRGKMCDFLLDWEDELPEPEFSICNKFAAAADLSICLGTTLQIEPVGKMPLLAKKNGGKFVTVNLQKTKHEKEADLAVHAKVDDVMWAIAKELGLSDDVQTESPQPIVRWHSDCPPFEFPKRKKKQI